MNIVAIIEARMGSTRLPGKVLLPLGGKPMLRRMFSRVLESRLISRALVATTVNDTDIEIGEIFRGAVSFGSEEDVLSRVLEAAQKFNVDIIVELTGDCPLIDPAMVDKVVADYLLGGADFVCNQLPYTTPRGMDVRVFSTEALAKVDKLTDDPADREHVSLYFWEHQDEFTVRNVATELPWPPHMYRLTVDTQEDYELVKWVFEELYPVNPRFTLWDILELLDKNPEKAELNRGVRQKAVR